MSGELPILAVDATYLARQRTGIENFVFQMLPRLAARWEPGSMLAFHGDAGALPELPAHTDLRPGGGRGWTQLRLPVALRAAGADVLFNPVPILPLMLPMPCPAVVTVHDLHEFRARWGYVRRLLQRTFARSAHIVCVSEATRQEVLAEFPAAAGKCSTVHEGADPAIFHPLPETRGATPLLQRLGIGEAPLLAVGTIMPRKNYARLVRAYARLGDSAPPLVIVGKGGEQHEAVMALPAQLGIEARVTFAGQLDEGDVAELMRSARLLCALSTGEGFGLPLVEAMYSGLPILASDIPPFREVAGHAARFVSPHDEAAIADSLAALLGDSGALATMRDVGLARRDLFSWDRAAEEIARILRRALT